MALYCSRELSEALEGIKFPATKAQIVSHATHGDASEAALISLNSLPDGVEFSDIGAVCDNVSIVCSLDVYRALEGIRFPATKAEVLAYAVNRNAPESALAALRALLPRHRYLSISEVCSNVLVVEGEEVFSNMTLAAIYEGGAFRPLEDVPLPEGWRVRLIVEPLGKSK
jgi:hypothetical protein